MNSKDLVDELFESLDLVDSVELDTEDKVLYSPELKKILRQEISKEISKIPLDEIFSKLKEHESSLKEIIQRALEKTNEKIDSRLREMKEREDKFIEKMKQKYADLRNSISSQEGPRYQFGGYPPPGGFLPLSMSGLDKWRLIITGDNGENLSVQRLENGVWVEKGSFQ